MNGAIGQTLALFHDAYRELNSKKMFWITMILSGVVVLSFLAIGVTTSSTVTIFGVDTTWPVSSASEMYEWMFSNLGVGLWLTLIGLILAIVSTASIFPDLITGGSIDLYLSKPISRLRLFLTRYMTGLLFATLQVLVFSTASFLVIGIRGGVWEPRLFLGVPIVVCFFSYLFCICVLIGLWTRSTLAAVLLTMLFWFAVHAVDQTETILLTLKIDNVTQLRTVKTAERRRELESSGRKIEMMHRLTYAAKTVLPKTRATNELLDRSLRATQPAEVTNRRERPAPRSNRRASQPPADDSTLARLGDPALVREVQAEQLSRPIWWVLGTSLAFEAVILAIAAWIFCRRDY